MEKCLPCKPRNLGLIPRTNIQQPGMENSNAREIDTGGSWGFSLPDQPDLVSSGPESKSKRERDPISEARYMVPERKIPKVSLWFPHPGAHTDRTTAASAAAEKEG